MQEVGIHQAPEAPVSTKRKSVAPHFCIAAGALLLLSSIATLSNAKLQFASAAIFVFTAWGIWRNPFRAYLALIAIYPLIPSHLSQLGIQEFSLLEILFLSFVFWWSILKIARRDALPSEGVFPYRSFFYFQFLYLLLSAIFVLLTATFLFSRISLLQLKEHWNLFLPLDASDPFGSLRALLTQLEGLLFFLISFDLLRTQERVLQAIKVIFYAAVAVSVVGLLQYAFEFRLLPFWIEENPNLIRINSTWDDPNSLGTYLAAVISLGIFSMRRETMRLRWKLVCFCVLLAALWSCGSRSALAAVFLAVIVFPFLLRQAGRKIRPPDLTVARFVERIAGLVIIAVIALIAIATWLNHPAEKPSNWVEFLGSSLNLSRPASTVLKGRIYLWETAAGIFAQHPLFGSGLGSFLPLVASRPYDYPQLRVPQNVHNYFLQMLAETGIFGLTLFATILFFFLKRAIALLRRQSGEEMMQLFGFLCVISIFLVTSLTGHPLLLPKMQLVFWGVLAFVWIYSHTSILPDLTNASKKVLWIFILIFAVGFPLQVYSAYQSRSLPTVEAGYHNWEADAVGRLFRWTKKDATSDLLVQGDAISFQLRNGGPANPPPTAMIYLNHDLRERRTLTSANWSHFYYSMNPAEKRKRILLEIKTDRTFSPQDSGQADARQLGLQITPFQWECGSRSAEASSFAILRETNRISGVSVLAIPQQFDQKTLRVFNSAQQEIPHVSSTSLTLSLEIAASNSLLLYSAKGGDRYQIDGAHGLKLKNTLDLKYFTLRIVANARIKGTKLPVLYVRMDGKQVIKIPIFETAPTPYYAHLKGPANAFTFFNWDDLSSISKETDTPIEISEIQVTPHVEPADNFVTSGWAEMPEMPIGNAVESRFTQPLSLLRTGQTLLVRNKDQSGIASLIISASAQLAGPEPPSLAIYAGDHRVGSVKIESPERRDYTISVPIRRQDVVKITFENDYFNAARKEDRNVIVYRLRLEPLRSILIVQPIFNPVLPAKACYSLRPD